MGNMFENGYGGIFDQQFFSLAIEPGENIMKLNLMINYEDTPLVVPLYIREDDFSSVVEVLNYNKMAYQVVPVDIQEHDMNMLDPEL